MSSQNRVDYVETCKQENADFIKHYDPLIVYVREPGVAQYDPNDLTIEPRLHRGKPFGVVVTYLNEDGVLIQGWSKVNTRSGDKWNRQIGLHKAIRGASQYWDLDDTVHYTPKWKMVMENMMRYARLKLAEIRKKKQEKAEGDIHSFIELDKSSGAGYSYMKDSLDV